LRAFGGSTNSRTDDACHLQGCPSTAQVAHWLGATPALACAPAYCNANMAWCKLRIGLVQHKLTATPLQRNSALARCNARIGCAKRDWLLQLSVMDELPQLLRRLVQESSESRNNRTTERITTQCSQASVQAAIQLQHNLRNNSCISCSTSLCA